MTRVPFSAGFFSMELKRRALQPIASRKSIRSVVRKEGPDWFDSEGPPHCGNCGLSSRRARGMFMSTSFPVHSRHERDSCIMRQWLSFDSSYRHRPSSNRWTT
jgi:hypothetical protein